MYKKITSTSNHQSKKPIYKGEEICLIKNTREDEKSQLTTNLITSNLLFVRPVLFVKNPDNKTSIAAHKISTKQNN